MKSRKILSSLVLLVFFVGLLATSQSLSVQAAGGQVVIGTTDSIDDLDPADAYDYFSSNILVQLTHGLMQMPIDSTDAEKGPIVESYSVSPNAMEYTFELKTDIKFSDGTAFNATAMKWNIDRVLGLPTGEPAFLLTDVINRTEAVDIDTFKVYLQFPDATFLQRLTYTVAWPVSTISLPVDALSGTPDMIPAGLGPYKVDTWTKGTEIILVPNEYYFGDPPKNDKLIVKFYTDASTMLAALESGDIDVAHRVFGPDEMDSIMDNPDLEYGTKSSAGIRYILINVDMYDDINVRRALAAAVNRTEIVDTIFDNYNVELYSMIPGIFSSHVDAFMEGPDQDAVAGNMTLSGYVKDTNKFDLELWYTPTHYGDTEDDVALLLKTQFEATGFFDVTVSNTEWSQYLDQRQTMGFYLLGWWFDYPDPSNYVDPFVGSGAVSFGTNYSTTEMDGYIDTMLTDPDADDRLDATIGAQELMAEDVPLIPLFTMLSQFSAWQPGVKGVVLEPSENLHYNSIYVSAAGIPGFEFLTAFIAIFSIGIVLKRKK
ncbi:MAG: peptide ABC transporter substrate-binding protein [Candidatus Heimdallarchaeota archaeon]|nr:peptide ABC transporter substrate-binding protein [Candidatus Heimdallarchaeota archaeon]